MQPEHSRDSIGPLSAAAVAAYCATDANATVPTRRLGSSGSPCTLTPSQSSAAPVRTPGGIGMSAPSTTLKAPFFTSTAGCGSYQRTFSEVAESVSVNSIS